MPRIPRSPVGVALVLYRGWMLLPPAQRRQVLAAARTHGPQLAAKAAVATKAVAARKAAARKGDAA